MPLPTAIIIAALAAQTAPAPLLAQGTIAVARSAPGGSGPTEAFADAVEGALIDAGFVVIPGVANARYVVTLKVTRNARGAVRTRAARPKATTGGGMTFGNGVGAGVSIPFGSKEVVGQLVATELTLRIVRRGGGMPAWEGRAITYQVAGTSRDDPASLAKILSAAILRNLNGPSGVLVSTP